MHRGLGKRLYEAVCEMSSISDKLFDKGEFKLEDIVHSKLFCSKHDSYPSNGTDLGEENEQLRTVFFQAKLLGIKLVLPVIGNVARGRFCWEGERIGEIWQSLNLPSRSLLILGNGDEAFNQFLVKQAVKIARDEEEKCFIANEVVYECFNTLLVNEELLSDDEESELEESEGEQVDPSVTGDVEGDEIISKPDYLTNVHSFSDPSKTLQMILQAQTLEHFTSLGNTQ